MNTIRVRTRSASYPVICGRGTLARLGRHVAPLCGAGEIFVLSSPRVWKHWGSAVGRALGRGRKRPVILLDDREVKKRLATVESVSRDLTRARADRQALLIAVGGGVVGDVAGFVAATYLRGVRLVHVPTTVVAQADSSIGGKTGVNLPEGKNLVGAFYPPQMVIADPLVLRTLSSRQFRSGVYEIIKYGVIGDAELFEFLERRIERLVDRDPRAVAWAIGRGVRQKAAWVRRDERESGVRQILNFGHTIGHALESATGYKRFLHGEAIGWGMLGAALIGVGMGLLPEPEGCRIAALIARCGPLPELPPLAAARLMQIVSGDKKSRGGKVAWVIPRRVGRADVGIEVPEPLVAMAWRELPRFFAQARNAK